MSPTSPHDFQGTQRFRVRRLLGTGGMGAVYEADDRERGERVALKMLLRRDARGLLRFKNEFRALQDLDHPNLVRLGELVEADGAWFFSMELVEGRDLLSYVYGDAGEPQQPAEADAAAMAPAARSRPAPSQGIARYDEARLRDAFQQLARGIDALHAAHKIHRDIKPSNVLVTADGRVVLLDFGLVAETALDRQSVEAGVLGTAAYMAPEQAASKAIGPEADWYAFGTVLYEALTGSLPFAGSSLEMLMNKQRHDPAPPRARVPEVPPDLDQLCVDLLQFEPEARPAAREVFQRLGVAEAATTAPVTWVSQAGDRPRFVGRMRELRSLREAFASSRRGEPALAYVHGPSGVGKSALVAHFLDELATNGDDGNPEVVLLRGRCYEREAVPYKAVDGAIDALSVALQRMPYAEGAAVLPRAASLLPTLFPVLGRVDAIANAPRLRTPAPDPLAERQRAFAALRELLLRLCERRAVVVSIDDFQWADADSLALLRALLTPGDGCPALLLVVTSRNAALLRNADDTEGELSWTSVAVGPLAPEDADQVAAALIAGTGATPAPAEIAAITAESEGHPLFIAELVRHVSTTGRAPGERPSLDDAIWRRANELEPAARGVLELLALATSPLSVDAIERAADLRGRDLARVLALLRVAGFVRSAGRLGRDVGPFHDRVREAVAAKVDPALAVRAHGRLATALESDSTVAPESIAYHARAAGLTAKAVTYYERAADRAAAGLAFDRAVSLYREVLELGSAPPAEASALRVRLGDALAYAGRGADAAGAYVQALDGADTAEQIRLRTLAATHLLRSGHVSDGLAALDGVVEAVGLSLPRSRSAAMAGFAVQRARLLVRGYRFTPRDPSEVSGLELIRVDALAGVAEGLGWVDGVRAAGVSTRWLHAALDAGEPRRALRALCVEAVFASLGGPSRARRAEAILNRARELARTLSGPEPPLFVRASEALVALHECRFGDTLRLATDVASGIESLPQRSPWELATGRLVRLFGLLMTGQWGTHVTEAEALLRDADERRDRWFSSLLRVLMAPYVALTRDDDPGKARALLDRGIEPWRDREFGLLHFNWLQSATVVDLYVGAGDTALERLRQHRRDLVRSGSLRVQLLRTTLTACHAAAHLASYDRDRDRASLARARRLAGKLLREGASLAGGMGRTVLAGHALRRGDETAALTELMRAEDCFAACQMHGFRATVRWQRGALLGGDEGASLTRDSNALFQRERVTNVQALRRCMGLP